MPEQIEQSIAQAPVYSFFAVVTVEQAVMVAHQVEKEGQASSEMAV